MSLRRRIDRVFGHAASSKAAATRRARQPQMVVVPVEPVPFDAFLSESTDDASTALEAPVPPKPRLAHGFQILSDTDAFLSEVAACESDRPGNRNDVDTIPVDGGFLSEEDDLPALHAAAAIDELLQGEPFASESGAEQPDGVAPLVRWSSSRVLSRAVSLVALSASFFVAVILFSEALDRVNQVLFTHGGAPPAERPVDAAMTGAVVPDVAPLTARPFIQLARFKSHTASAVARSESDGELMPPTSIAMSPVVDPRTSIVRSIDRQIELPARESATASLVESPVLALEPVHVALAPPPSPPLVVARAISESAGPTPAPLAAPNETDKIDGVLSRYRGAFNTLDSSAARGVWPTVDERALDRAFARLQQQEVAFDRCDIDVAGIHAAARCTGSARYVPKVGSRTPQTTTREWRFNLQKVDDRWVIEDVDAR